MVAARLSHLEIFFAAMRGQDVRRPTAHAVFILAATCSGEFDRDDVLVAGNKVVAVRPGRHLAHNRATEVDDRDRGADERIQRAMAFDMGVITTSSSRSIAAQRHWLL